MDMGPDRVSFLLLIVDKKTLIALYQQNNIYQCNWENFLIVKTNPFILDIIGCVDLMRGRSSHQGIITSLDVSIAHDQGKTKHHVMGKLLAGMTSVVKEFHAGLSRPEVPTLYNAYF